MTHSIDGAGHLGLLYPSLAHRDRLRDGPCDAGATFEANHFETVPTPLSADHDGGDSRDECLYGVGFVDDGVTLTDIEEAYVKVVIGHSSRSH